MSEPAARPAGMAGRKQPKVKAGGIIRESLDNSWMTPESILERVRVYFGGPIPLDPATATSNPTAAIAYHTAPVQPDLFNECGRGLVPSAPGGLAVPWDAPVFCNPPYGREINAFLLKFAAEAKRGTTIIALIPCSRFEGLPMNVAMGAADAMCLIRGRVAFISSLDGQPVPGNPSASMVLGFNVIERLWRQSFGPLGACYALRAMGD